MNLQTASDGDRLAEQEACPFWTSIILSCVYYQLKDYEMAKAALDKFLKDLPTDRQTLGQGKVITTYQASLNNLIKEVEEEELTIKPHCPTNNFPLPSEIPSLVESQTTAQPIRQNSNELTQLSSHEEEEEESL